MNTFLMLLGATLWGHVIGTRTWRAMGVWWCGWVVPPLRAIMSTPGGGVPHRRRRTVLGRPSPPTPSDATADVLGMRVVRRARAGGVCMCVRRSCGAHRHFLWSGRHDVAAHSRVQPTDGRSEPLCGHPRPRQRFAPSSEGILAPDQALASGGSEQGFVSLPWAGAAHTAHPIAIPCGATALERLPKFAPTARWPFAWRVAQAGAAVARVAG